MPDFVETADALRAILASEFTALPLYWPNDDREPTLKDAPAGFVYSELQLVSERILCLGAHERQDAGLFVIWVHVPVGSRAGTAEQHAQAIRALFPVRIGDGRTVVESKRIGQGQRSGPQSRFWAVPIFIEFKSDRTE